MMPTPPGANIHGLTNFKPAMLYGFAFMAVCLLNFHRSVANIAILSWFFGRYNSISYLENLPMATFVEPPGLLAQITERF